MKTLTELMLRHGDAADRGFQLGAKRIRASKDRRRRAREIQATIRAKHGLAEKYAPLITQGAMNHKLGLATKFSVGLTLFQHVQKFSTGLNVNACPKAGHCRAVCVLDEGMYVNFDDRVKRARRARTEFFGRYPAEACFLYGWELADAVEKRGPLLNRPNIASDAQWELVLPSLTNGTVFGDDVLSYDYTKIAERVLPTNGWLGSHYRIAYSWNESSDARAVSDFVQRGGSVALVTSRRKGEPTIGRSFAEGTLGLLGFEVADADLTDAWIFQVSTIGDLSAKGKARSLIGRSGFVFQPGP